MKRSLVIFFLAAIIASCGNNSTTTDKKADAPSDPEVEKGMTLVANNGCFTCHQVEQASSGPAYTAVAARYPNNKDVIDSLAQKIIKGGSGNWGSVMMIAHPDVSPEDARTMVKYVLSLKK